MQIAEGCGLRAYLIGARFASGPTMFDRIPAQFAPCSSRCIICGAHVEATMRAVLFAIIGLACATVTPVLAQVTIEKNVVPAAPAPQGPVTQGLGGLTQYCGGFAGYTCGANQWCDFPVGSICGLGDQLGVCKPRPQVCTDQFIPVCGCDGKTYSNACQAAAGGTDVAYAGACRSPITAVGGGAAGQT